MVHYTNIEYVEEINIKEASKKNNSLLHLITNIYICLYTKIVCNTLFVKKMIVLRHI